MKMNKKEVIQGMTMVNIPAGSFMMGHVYEYDPTLPDTVNVFYPDEQPVHSVTLQAFQMGETQVTQAQYKRIMGENPSRFVGDNFPVTNTGAGMIEVFCNRLSQAAGLNPCYNEKSRTFDFSKNGFRLPSEEEWEYACRAGTKTHFYTGNTEQDLDRAGWYIGNSNGTTHPVAQKEPNAWGLYDMHGNVFEFCNDNWIPTMCYGKYLSERDTSLTFNYYHDLRVTRGGSWFDQPSVCRSAARSCFCNWPEIRQSYYIGFRVARNIG